jgi:hypothetical protein
MHAYRQLAPFGKVVGFLFLLLSAALTCASIGWFNHRIWGWPLAVAVVAIQILGGLVNILQGHAIEGEIGITIAGALLFYLLQENVRGAFDTGAPSKLKTLLRTFQTLRRLSGNIYPRRRHDHLRYR